MDVSANWIWTSEDDGKRNLTICARRTFTLTNKPTDAHLQISADSNYVLFINGERVGHGPARSWNHLKQYDEYEVSRYVKAGENIITVQIVRWGITHGRYAGGPGGLIASLRTSDAEKPVVITDSNWKMTVNPACVRNVPRMGWGQAFSEQYDARLELGDWTMPGFDDSKWANAVVLGPVGTQPWTEMKERTIPYLTEEPKCPVRVFDVCAVKPPSNSYALDLYEAMHISGRPTNELRPIGVIVAELRSNRNAQVMMVRMNQTCELDLFGEMRINGEEVSFQEDRAVFTVREGSNLLVMRYNRNPQSLPSWVFESESEIEMKCPEEIGEGPAAIFSGEVLDDPIITGCWAAKTVKDLQEFFSKLRPITREERYIDVFALSNMRRVLPNATVKLDRSYAICSANSEYAIAHPPSDGDLEFIIDFGEEVVGYLEFEIDAPAGTIIDFNCFESMIDSKWSWTDNLNNTLRYTAKDGWQRFQSTVRRGFRYVQVTIRNASRPVRIQGIQCLQNTYPVQNLGAFTSSDALLNAIWDIGRRTTRLCMEDTFVDCPTWEQTFWVGDSRNEALAAYAAFGDSALTAHCLKLAAESMWRSPMPECAVPTGYGGIIPDWSMFWVMACEEHYQQTGDLDFVKSIYPSVLQTCRFMLSKRNEKGLWQLSAWNMLDWAGMDCPPDGIITHENLLFVETLRRTANLADLIGSAEGNELRQEADLQKEAVNRHLWDDEYKAYVDSIHADGTPSKVISQQTQTMAYLCNCVPDDRLQWIEKYITEVPEGWVKIGSPWMMWFSIEALVKKGDFDTTLDWMRKNWGQMLEYDATTCWETFPSWGTGRWKPTRSWCHAWSAAPTYFLSTYQMGVRPIEPGWKKVMIAPHPSGLTWVKGRMPTPLGVIAVSWRVEGGKLNLSAIVPEGIEAEVRLPEGYEAGEIIIRKSDVTTSPTGVI